MPVIHVPGISIWRPPGPIIPPSSVDWDQKYTDAFNANAAGTTYWVSLAGSNGNNGLSKAQGFADTVYARSQMAGGDTLIIEDGLYTNQLSMLLNDNASSANPTGNFPTGSPGAYTIVRAETPFGVRLACTTNTDYFGHYISVNNSNYVWFDGFIVESNNLSTGSDAGYPELDVLIQGNRNRITRTIHKRSHASTYGQNFSIDGTNNLAQDVASVGAGRYNFISGPGATSGALIRRAVARQDFNDTEEPKAAFMLYSNTSDNATTNNHKQNIIAIDGMETSPPTPLDFSNYTFAGLYIRASSNINVTRGMICVNNDFGARGGFAGLYWEQGSDGNFEASDIIVWGNYQDSGGITGFVEEDEDPTGNVPIRFTIGANGTTVFTSQAFVDNANPPPDSYLSNTQPANILAAPGGASVKFAHGEFLSHTGDTNWDAITTDRLWPYPYEDVIRSVFSEQMNTPSGYLPIGNVSARGFCDDAIALSLTQYLHEFTGTLMDLDAFYA